MWLWTSGVTIRLVFKSLSWRTPEDFHKMQRKGFRPYLQISHGALTKTAFFCNCCIKPTSIYQFKFDPPIGHFEMVNRWRICYSSHLVIHWFFVKFLRTGSLFFNELHILQRLCERKVIINSQNLSWVDRKSNVKVRVMATLGIHASRKNMCDGVNWQFKKLNAIKRIPLYYKTKMWCHKS